MKQRPFITIVSGLPRSGTSLLMQVLAAGGMAPLTDGARAADDDNPHGYFELEAVKRLGPAAPLPPDAQGRAVKVIAALLPRLASLPESPSLRVLLMRRHLDEVLASQRRMLERLSRPGAPLSDAQLAAALARQVDAAAAWCLSAPNVRLMEVDHHALCTDPRPTCEAINEFLGGGLDIQTMERVPDRSLYRQRR